MRKDELLAAGLPFEMGWRLALLEYGYAVRRYVRIIVFNIGAFGLLYLGVRFSQPFAIVTSLMLGTGIVLFCIPGFRKVLKRWSTRQELKATTALKQHAAELDAEIGNRNRRIVRLENEVSSLDRKIVDLLRQLNERNEENSGLQSRIAQLDDRVVALNDQVAQRDSKISSLLDELEHVTPQKRPPGKAVVSKREQQAVGAGPLFEQEAGSGYSEDPQQSEHRKRGS